MTALWRLRAAVAAADEGSRRALWLSCAALLFAGLPVVGLVVAAAAVVVGQRARRSSAARAAVAGGAADPSRVAVAGLLLAVLAVLLSSAFTAIFVLLLQLG